jgi:C-terminal processing protease CtpA/Prc
MKSKTVLSMLSIVVSLLPGLYAQTSLASEKRLPVEIHERVEAAREKLDAAAAELRSAVVEAYAHSKPDQERAFLGILLEHRGSEAGIELSGVTPGGGAAAAGLAAGDVLVRIENVDLVGKPDPAAALMEVVQALKPGDTVDLSYQRGGKTRTVEVTTTGMFQSALATIEPKLAPWVEEEGFKSIARFMLDPEAGTAVLIDVAGDLAQYFGVESGILIVHAPERSGGLKAGDVLLAVDGRQAANAIDAQTFLLSGEASKKALVRRRGAEVTLDIDPRDYRSDGQDRVYVYRFDERTVPVAPRTPTAPIAPKAPGDPANPGLAPEDSGKSRDP